MNRPPLMTMLLVLMAAAVSPMAQAQAQAPKKPAPPAPAPADLLRRARAYAAALRAAPVGRVTQTAPVSAANVGPVLLGPSNGVDVVFAPSIMHGGKR